MKSLVIVLGLIAAALAAEMKCDKYICDPGLMAGVCNSAELTEDITRFHLKECNQSSGCNLGPDVNDTCVDGFVLPSRYPGEYCSATGECFVGECVNNSCSGLPEGGQCKEDMNCNPRLYCDKGACVPVKKIGDACSNTMKCDTHLTCNNQICTGVGSLDENMPATAVAACKSFFILNGQCKAGPKLLKKEGGAAVGPVTCVATQGCVYTITPELNFTDTCQCGRTPEGDMYCPPGKGDMDLTDVNTILSN